MEVNLLWPEQRTVITFLVAKMVSHDMNYLTLSHALACISAVMVIALSGYSSKGGGCLHFGLWDL